MSDGNTEASKQYRFTEATPSEAEVEEGALEDDDMPSGFKMTDEQIIEAATHWATSLIGGQGFYIDKAEEEGAKKFFLEHMTKHNGAYEGAIGGRYTVSFTPTSIGTIVTLSCACGAKQDVSGLL